MPSASKKTSSTVVKRMLNLGSEETSQSAQFNAPSDPLTETMIRVKITDIEPYENNLRITRNAMYEEIKSSIKSRGLDQSFSITRKQGDAHYTVAQGGNTRLSVLKDLYQETEEDRFLWQELKFIPWQGEQVALVGHLIENDLRADFTFYERARGVVLIREQLKRQSADQQPPSLSTLSEFLSSNGYKIDRSTLSRMIFSVETLFPIIPNALRGGLGEPSLRVIKKLISDAEKVLIHFAKTDRHRNTALIQTALARADSKHWNLDAFKTNLLAILAEDLEMDMSQVKLALSGAQSNDSLEDITEPQSSGLTSSGEKPSVDPNVSTRAAKRDSAPASLGTLRGNHLKNATELATLVSLEHYVQPIKNLGFGYLVTDVPDPNHLEQLSLKDPKKADQLRSIWFHLISLSGSLAAFEDKGVADAIMPFLLDQSMLKASLQLGSTDVVSEVHAIFRSPFNWSYSLIGVLAEDQWMSINQLEHTYRALWCKFNNHQEMWNIDPAGVQQ